ncbi:MAG: discoidin domain-containing protein, partial [Bacteroidales bacterium]|nr:discoidin domain-containing protein [Bacteroidales bacterium]
RRGLIHPIDSANLIEFGKAIEKEFAHNYAGQAKFEASNVRGGSRRFAASQVAGNGYWATDDGVTEASLTASFRHPVTLSKIVLQEHITLGQRVQAFTVEALIDGQWQLIESQTTIGHKRILRFDPVTTSAIRVNITAAKACIALDNVGLY